MSEAQHDLVTEFPNFKDRIHELKVSNAHFRKLFEDYHEVTRTIARAEQRIDLISNTEEEQLRKKRLVLKDELYAMMSR